MLEGVGFPNALFLSKEVFMKKDRNARKELLDLYLYLDVNSDLHINDFSKEQLAHYEEIKDNYDKRFKGRLFNTPFYWTEYYGLFKLADGRIGIDPKRFNSKL